MAEGDQFPGEGKDSEEVTEGKWAVAESDGESLKIRKEGLKLLSEADRWIKENIKEGEVLVSIRLGIPRKLEVKRVLSEVEL